MQDGAVCTNICAVLKASETFVVEVCLFCVLENEVESEKKTVNQKGQRVGTVAFNSEYAVRVGVSTE